MTTRHYVTLGKILCVEYPEIASKLTQQINDNTPVFSDLGLLPKLLDIFCSHFAVKPEQVKGPDTGRLSEKSRLKQTFVTVVVKLYSPDTLGPTKHILMTGLRQELSIQMQTRGDQISRFISNARLYLRTYKDFKKEVEETYKVIIEKTDGIKKS